MLKWPLLITLVIFSTCKRNISVVNDFPPMVWPKDNLYDMEKVAIGEKLFFDPILSINKKISCSTCHVPSLAFTDGKKVSNGLFPLSRSAPSLLNIGFHSKGLFWDGRASTLENQALIPVSSSLEMGLPWAIAEKRINESAVYAKAFKKIYGDIFIDSLKIASVLAQYQSNEGRNQLHTQ